MICITPKPSNKNSEIIGVSLLLPLSQDLNPLAYALRGFLENKTNVTSHPNIGFFNTSIE